MIDDFHRVPVVRDAQLLFYSQFPGLRWDNASTKLKAEVIKKVTKARLAMQLIALNGVERDEDT